MTYGDATKFMPVDEVLKNLATKFLELNGLLALIAKEKNSGSDERRFVDFNILKRATNELQRIDKTLLTTRP